MAKKPTNEIGDELVKLKNAGGWRQADGDFSLEDLDWLFALMVEMRKSADDFLASAVVLLAHLWSRELRKPETGKLETGKLVTGKQVTGKLITVRPFADDEVFRLSRDHIMAGNYARRVSARGKQELIETKAGTSGTDCGQLGRSARGRALAPTTAPASTTRR